MNQHIPPSYFYDVAPAGAASSHEDPPSSCRLYMRGIHFVNAVVFAVS